MQTNDDLYAGYKHGESIKRIISYMHEPWMGENDKREFDELMVRIHGKELDIALTNIMLNSALILSQNIHSVVKMRQV